MFRVGAPPLHQHLNSLQPGLLCRPRHQTRLQQQQVKVRQHCACMISPLSGSPPLCSLGPTSLLLPVFYRRCISHCQLSSTLPRLWSVCLQFLVGHELSRCHPHSVANHITGLRGCLPVKSSTIYPSSSNDTSIITTPPSSFVLCCRFSSKPLHRWQLTPPSLTTTGPQAVVVLLQQGL